jgi:hypothetical protein
MHVGNEKEYSVLIRYLNGSDHVGGDLLTSRLTNGSQETLFFCGTATQRGSWPPHS